MGATYTSETRKNIVKSRSEEKLAELIADDLKASGTMPKKKKTLFKDEETEKDYGIRLKNESHKILQSTKPEDMEKVAKFNKDANKFGEANTGAIGKPDNDAWSPYTYIRESIDLGKNIEKTKEAMEKFFNLMHFELENVTGAFEKFANKNKFSDRTKLLKNNLEIAISTMQDKLISLYESNIDTIEGGKYKDASAHVKESKVQSFASNVQKNGNTTGQIINMSQGIGGDQAQKQFKAETKNVYSQALIAMQSEMIDQEKDMLKFLTNLELPESVKSEIYGEIANQLQKELNILIAKSKSNNALPADIARMVELQSKLQKGFTVDPDSVTSLEKEFEALKIEGFGLSNLQAKVSELASQFSTIDMEKTKEYLTLLSKITEENKRKAKTMQENLMKSFEDMFELFTNGNFRVKATMENAMKNMNDVIKVIFADTARTLLGMKDREGKGSSSGRQSRQESYTDDAGITKYRKISEEKYQLTKATDSL
ncbi:MAG: hypothetical protein ACRC5T_04130, partial [Cetobacterium sp.]